MFTLSWPSVPRSTFRKLPHCTFSSSFPFPSGLNGREHHNRSLVYFLAFFLRNMPLRLAAWLLSLASSNIVLIKNRWEANRHSETETEKENVLKFKWRCTTSISNFPRSPSPFGRLSCLCKFVIFCIREVNRVHLAHDLWWISSGLCAWRLGQQGKKINWAQNLRLLELVCLVFGCFEPKAGSSDEAQQVSHPPSMEVTPKTSQSCLECTRQVTSKKCVGSNNVACISNDICHVSVAWVRAFSAFIFSSGRSDMSVSPSPSVYAQNKCSGYIWYYADTSHSPRPGFVQTRHS